MIAVRITRYSFYLLFLRIHSSYLADFIPLYNDCGVVTGRTGRWVAHTQIIETITITEFTFIRVLR